MKTIRLNIPDNIILLLRATHCPEVNPIEWLWEELKEDLSWNLFNNLDHLRTKVKNILNSPLLSLWENSTKLRCFSLRKIKVSPQFDKRGIAFFSMGEIVCGSLERCGNMLEFARFEQHRDKLGI